MLASACVILVLGGATGAQQRPDFSGTWVVISPAEAAGQEETIQQDATMLRRGHASEGGGHSFIYRLDGTQSRLVMPSHGDEIVTLAKASWDGDRLVIVEAVTYPDGRKLAKTSVLALDAQGQLVKEFTEQFEGKPAKTTRIVSKKKG
jgi:hypothetical protein